jgi:hypothetical protein
VQGSKLLHRIFKFINYVNLCKFIQIHKKCFFISWPISIIIVLFGRASLATQNLYTEFWNFTPLIIIYVNLFIIHKKCFFSLISRPILILIVLSHRARCRVEKLYTEFWNSLIMLIYANLFKFTKNASSPSFLDRFWIWLFYLVELSWLHKTCTQNCEILLHSLNIIIYVNLFIIHKKCFSLISRPILILIVLSHRARCRVEKLYTEFWNSLIKLIYANLFKCIHICSLSVKLYMYVSRSVGGWGQRHLGLKMLIVQNPFLGVKFSTFYWPRNRARLVVREPPCIW